MARASGVLAHISSLPSRQGIGSVGGEARTFATALAEAGQRYWQMLPVGPTGYRDSPYQSPSTFAGNPLLIDFNDLVDQGLLKAQEVAPLADLPQDRVDFGRVIEAKNRLLVTVAARLQREPDLDNFFSKPWLENYVAYAALKEAHDQRPWTEWPTDLVHRRQPALGRALKDLRQAMEAEVAIQFLFHRQWRALHDHCRKLGLGLIGDLPIFVAHDSADVWANPELFHLAPSGEPTVVAGVPPDYFSKTGQRWGNPLYRWDAQKADDYSWWKERMQASFERFDLVRVDHFRGFIGNWEIPASEETAVKGRWVSGPGVDLFEKLSAEKPLPIIAEDLGVITPEVTALRQQFGFPGMRVAQFGFDDESNTALHHPDNYPIDVVAYTGTHDNDTTVGWFWGDNQRHDRRRLTKGRRQLLTKVGTHGESINWDLIGLVLGSHADTAIVPVQDLLGLGSEARMNTPGKEEGNWTWRMQEPISESVWSRLHGITANSQRKVVTHEEAAERRRTINDQSRR